MTNFVLDNTNLPYRERSSVSADKPIAAELSAAELMDMVRASYDLRDFLGGGGLVTPEVYGAAGDGIKDDTVPLQLAVTLGAGVGGTLVFRPGATYGVTAEVAYVGPRVLEIQGNGATIKYIGTGAPRAVLSVVGQVIYIERLTLDGDRYASYGLFLQDSSTSVFDRVVATGVILDGFHSEADNDRCRYTSCQARVCGKVFTTTGYDGPAPAILQTAVTGTVSKTSGTTCVITRDSGTVDFTTMGIRAGDFISVDATAPGGNSAEWLQILTVDSATQITCVIHPASSGAASNLRFSIHVGDGYHEGPGRADNNINQLDNFLGENCGGCGAFFFGLYGPRCTNLQFNACCAYPVAVAYAGSATIGASFVGNYFEINGAADNFFLGNAQNVFIANSNVVGLPILSSSSFSFGWNVAMQNGGDPGRVDPIGDDPVDYVPAAVINQDALMRGTVYGRSYAAASAIGNGLIKVNDGAGAAFDTVSGAEEGYGADNDSIAFRRRTSKTITQLDPVNPFPRVTTKYADRVLNNTTHLWGVQYDGAIVTQSGTDTGASPVTINKPSGKVRIASGTSAVTVTCAQCYTSSHCFISKEHNDATATDFRVVCSNGSFTITANGNATANVDLHFWLINNA